MALSIKEYKQMLANNQIKWDTDALNGTGKAVSDYLSGVEAQSRFEGQKWSRDEFEKQRGQIGDLRGRLRYMQAYANSLKGKDEKRYGEMLDSCRTLSDGLDQAEQWFRDNREGFLRHKQWQAVEETKRAAQLEPMVQEIDAAEKQIDAQNAALYGKGMTGLWGDQAKAPAGLAANAKDKARKTIAEKYGITVEELNSRYARYRKDQQAQQQAAKMNDALAKLRTAGMTHVAEVAAETGVDEKALTDNYKAVRAKEKQEERDSKYGGMGFDELVQTLKSPDSLGQRIYNEIQEEYGTYFKDYGDFDKNAVFKSRGEKYGLTGEQVREIYDRMHNANDKHYESTALGDTDKEFVVSRILQTGTVEQLEELQKTLPVAKHYDSLRYQLRQAIEDKKEQRYYLDIAAHDPDAARAIEGIAAIDKELLSYTASTGEKAPNHAANPINSAFPSPSNASGSLMRLQEERAAYVHELKTKGYDVDNAVKYYKRYDERRQNEQAQAAVKDWTSQNGFNAAVASIASVPINMFGSMGDALKFALGNLVNWGDDGWYDPKGTANYIAQNIRSTTSEMIDNATKDSGAWNYWAKQLYNTGMSTGDMVLAAAVNAVPVVGQAASNAMFFSSAGVNAANEVIENGGSLGQATLAMVASGSAELLFERVSLDKLEALATSGNVANAKEFFKDIVKQAFVEGSEEFNTTLANTFADALINGGNNSIERSKRSYMAQGMSEQEAESAAIKDWTQGIVDDTVGGALSGLLLGGAAGTKNALATNRIENVAGLAMTVNEWADLTGSDSGKAQEVAESIISENGNDKKEAIDKVLKTIEKNTDGQTRQTAQHFAELNEQGKLQEADAAALLVRAAREQVTVNGIDAAARTLGVETLSDFREKQGKEAQLYAGFDLAGNKTGSESTGAASSSFGAAHPNGMIARDRDGKTVTVLGVESSLPEYGGDGSHTVTLRLSDGSFADAAGIELGDTAYERLLQLAPNYDTLGARALLANFDSAQAAGMPIDDYIGAFQALYAQGARGVTFESAQQHPQMQAVIRNMGEQAARAAMEAGTRDGDILSQSQGYIRKRVRVKGKALHKSKVITDLGVHIELSEDAREFLDLVAEKTGKNIVLTNTLSDEDRGIYSDNTIYLNANKEEHVMMVTALHEAVHNMKVYAPEDYRTLEKFVFNYLAAQGKDIRKMLDSIAAVYGKDAATEQTREEELVCKTVEGLAADRDALATALGVKENISLKEKIGDILKRIADRVMAFFKGDKALQQAAHNRYAHVFLEDVQALRDMADIVSRGFESARENEREFGKANAATKHSIVTLDDGKQYIQADRQVLSGDDPIKWEEQIEQYINSQIRHNEDIILPTSDGHFLILTERSAYKLSDRHVSEIAKTVERFLSDEQYRLKGKAATHIDELVKVARFEKNREDIGNKHENDIGEDGFNYYIAFFMDFDGEYYKISFSSAQNANKETVYSIGKVEKRKFPNRHGSSSKNGALKNGRKSSSPIIYTTDDKSQEVKTAIQLAFEKAFKKQSEKSKVDNNLIGPKSKDDTIYDDFDENVILPFEENAAEDDIEWQPIDTKKLMKTGTPDGVIYTLHQSLSKTAVRTIKESANVELSEEERLQIARRIMREYHIRRKDVPGLDERIAKRIGQFITDIEEKSKADVSTHINGLITDCRKWLENSGKYERGFMQDTANKVKLAMLGKTLILPLRAESYILGDYGGMDNLRNAYSGFINVVREENKENCKKPVYIDELLQELSKIQTVRELFPDGEIPDEYSGWGFLDNLIGNVLRPKFVNPFYKNVYENVDDAAVEMASAFATAIVDVKTVKSVKEKTLDRATQRAIADSRRKMVAERNALHDVKFEKYRSLKRVNQYYVSMEKTNFRQEYLERQRKAQYLKQLGRKLGSLTKRLDGKANRNEYIPETLKQPLLSVLQLFDAKQKNSGNIPGYFGAFRNLDEVGARVEHLARVYSKLEGSKEEGKVYKNLGFDINSAAFNSGVLTDLEYLADTIKGKNVYQMTADDLEMTVAVLNDLDNQLKRCVEMIVDGKREQIQEFAGKGIAQTKHVRYHADSKHLLMNAVRSLRNKMITTSLDPVRFGRLLSGYRDDGVWSTLMSDLHRGEQHKILIMQRAYSRLQDDVIAKYDRKELVYVQRKAVEQFTMKDIDTGADVKLSQDMLLSVYLTDRQADGHRHLYNDKFNRYTRLPDLDYLNKNRVLPDVTGNKTKATGEKSHRVRFTKENLEDIRRYVESTPLLKELADGINEVFNGLIAEEINKVSLQQQGRMIATVQDYFPIRVDSDDPGKKFETNTEGEGIFTDERLKSRSFTKQRIRSETAVVITGALDVFQQHVNDAAEWCGMTVPVENIKKVLNSDDGNMTVRKALEVKFGHDALHYMDKLLGDIQKKKDHTDENLFTKATGRAMGAALAVNPRSTLKNWAALPLANRYFGFHHVTAATFKGLAGGKKIVEKYQAYTPYMWYRAQGNGTVVGELSRQHGLYGRWNDKLDIMSWADQRVVNSLLYAAEAHVKQTTDLEYDSEEFKQEVARQFEKCVDESQPNSMITSKPQFVRNDIMRALGLNAFASQRMAMGNSLMDSFMEYSTRLQEYRADKNAESRQAKNDAKKKLLRTMLGVMESGILQTVLGVLATVLVYHKWDDYKDEDGNVTWGSFWSHAGIEMLKGLPEEIAGGFAWLDKLYGAAEKLWDKDSYGADFGNMSVNKLGEIINAVYSGDWTKAWGNFADLTGMPLFGGTNMQRLFQSVVSYAKDGVFGKLGFMDNKGKVDLTYMDVQIAEAYREGNGEQATWLRTMWENELEKQGRVKNPVEHIDKKLVQALANGHDDIKRAYQAKDSGDLKTYKAVKDKYLGMGLSETVFDKAVTKAGNADKEDTPKSKSAKSEYTYQNAFDALQSGDTESYAIAKKSIAETMVQNGKAKDEKEAGDKVDKDLRSLKYTKALFEAEDKAYHNDDGDGLRRVQKSLLLVYGDRTALNEARKRFKKSKQKKSG